MVKVKSKSIKDRFVNIKEWLSDVSDGFIVQEANDAPGILMNPAEGIVCGALSSTHRVECEIPGEGFNSNDVGHAGWMQR